MRTDRGSLSLELALLVPVLLAVVAFIAGAAALGRARAEIDDAAWEAARAASLTHSRFEAGVAARSAVDRRLAEGRWSCDGRAVDVDLSRFEAGGSVAVAVTCQVRLGDAGMLLPGATRVSARAVEPLDRFKAFQ